MRKTVLTVAIILVLSVSLVTGIIIVNDVKANAFFIFKSVPPIPDTIPPIITITSPKNNTIYKSNNVYFSFNISKPQPPISLESGIASVRYTLDNNRTSLYYCTHYNSRYPPGLQKFTYSDNLTLPIGKHTLVVEAGGVVLPGNMTIYGSGSSSTVSFTIANKSESVIPEFPSWFILPLFSATTLFVVLFRKRLFRQRS